MKTTDGRYDGLKHGAKSAMDRDHGPVTRTKLDPDAKLVIVVDDDLQLRRMLTRTILAEFSDAVVIQADNGRDALDKLAEIRIRYLCDPLLIVTDLDMPKMDGWTMIRRLKEDYEGRGARSGIPVLVMSSTSGEKGAAFYHRSVHSGKSGYTPLVAVAKVDCTRQDNYFAVGIDGLTAWLRHFLDGAGRSPQAASIAKHLRA